MIYEMRIYRCVPGRLPALLQRFEKVTLKTLEETRHPAGRFWTTLIGDSNQELTYLLAWESLAEREKKWNSVYERSRVDFRRAPKAKVTGRSFRMRATRSFSRPRFPR